MQDLLQLLRKIVAANPQQAFFDVPAQPEEIDALETAIGLPLPKSYRQFLETFNGGFINITRLNPGEQLWNLKTARWNSNDLLGTQAIQKEYYRMAEFARDVFGVEGKWEFIPFCKTSGQEHLVFGPATAPEDSPVLSAFHECPPEEWSVLYPNFQEFFRAYLGGDGKLRTIAGI